MKIIIRNTFAERFSKYSYVNSRLVRAKVHGNSEIMTNGIYGMLSAKCGTLSNAIIVTNDKKEITCKKCLAMYSSRFTK